jgi:group I intron endonuclease
MVTPVAIYKIQNVVDGRMYIGQTVNPAQRAKRHFWKNNGCIKLGNAIQFYGRDKFVFSVLCWCVDKADANEAEALLIALADTRANGYNITPGGFGTGVGSDNPFFGRQHTAALKERFAEDRRGKPMPDAVRQKIANANRHRTMTETTKEKLRARPKSELCSLRTAEANKARVWTEEAREKLAVKNRGKKMPEEARLKIAEANKRRVWSSESRAKLSASKRKAGVS